MRLRKEKRLPVIVNDEAMHKRVKSLPNDQLVMWFETGVAGIGELVDAVVHHGAPDDEVTKTLESLLVMWREIVARGEW